jgi:hypothetical protein
MWDLLSNKTEFVLSIKRVVFTRLKLIYSLHSSLQKHECNLTLHGVKKFDFFCRFIYHSLVTIHTFFIYLQYIFLCQIIHL